MKALQVAFNLLFLKSHGLIRVSRAVLYIGRFIFALQLEIHLTLLLLKTQNLHDR